MGDFESFLELNKHVDAIREKDKTREAAMKVANLIDEVLSYICNSVPSGLSGAYCSLHTINAYRHSYPKM